MIVLDARENHDVVFSDADVVEELRLLAPEDIVVLVAFDDERRRIANQPFLRVPDPRLRREILRDVRFGE